MAVVVTYAQNAKPLLLPNKSIKAKRKPLGVTPPKGKQQPDDAAASGSVATDLDPPNLFINVVDTISGRVLHWASHTHAARPQQPMLDERAKEDNREQHELFFSTKCSISTVRLAIQIQS